MTVIFNKDKRMGPCVRCGSEGQIVEDLGSYGYKPGFLQIICSNMECGIKSPSETTSEWEPEIGTYNTYDKALAYVIYWWNWRQEKEDDGD